MDVRTDEKIREVVRTELKEQTVISVAHRIGLSQSYRIDVVLSPHSSATIIDFDLILVLENGEIVESGSPGELMGNPESQFRRLAQSQCLGLDDSDGSSIGITGEKET